MLGNLEISMLKYIDKLRMVSCLLTGIIKEYVENQDSPEY